jgi:succinoglycan biosynthesis protein ExoA
VLTDWPSVSVVMPVRNEARHLHEAVEAVLNQDYPGRLELVMALAPSEDDTAEVAAKLAAGDDRVFVVDNPAGITPAGLNCAIDASTGEVVVRVDGHSVLPPGYVKRAVEVLEETGADNVGGIQHAEGTTDFERAVAAARSTKFGAGDARHHYGGEPGSVDTVYLGVFRRSALERVGGFDEHFARAQDAELNHRIRTTGGIVWFTPDLRVVYRPRGSLRALARQYYHSGVWRRVVVREHPESVRWRQLVPPAAAVANIGGLLLALGGRRAGLLAPATYTTAVVIASAATGRGLEPRVARWLPAVFAVMHHAWGLGFLLSPRRLAAHRNREPSTR